MTKNKKIIQLTLLLFGLFLILVTYFVYPKFNEQKITSVTEQEEETEIGSSKDNSFEDVEYKGLYDTDNNFTVKAEKAFIKEDDPNLVYMKNMKVNLYMKDGRIIVITSDEGSYNKTTYDCLFRNNVRATDDETIIIAENLDLFATNDTATVYNDVVLTNDNGSLKADKVDYDFETKYYQISMFGGEKIKIKLFQWAILKNLE